VFHVNLLDIFSLFCLWAAVRADICYQQYADNKQVYVEYSTRRQNDGMSSLELYTADIQSWCASRCLQLNTTKTEFVLFWVEKLCTSCHLPVGYLPLVEVH